MHVPYATSKAPTQVFCSYFYSYFYPHTFFNLTAYDIYSTHMSLLSQRPE